ncbi:cfbf31d2-ab9a-469c-8755-ac7af03c6fee-CDS [Sclerotinia trifoliorum]|uniref:Cfbf31d2-ab9a-469c-8755-ac7af03c6fee-CDS n=1 Tax=Sclerotinia trifoliorum TaxID=28548 RepID=A0A8H2VM76_9HELO|nr:cfbf31d2-ab9a-469c-8755-ac7af03c6fee-CDS [Sclerotinia trifoliorum]
MAQNSAQRTRDQLLRAGWTTEQIDEERSHYPRSSGQNHPVPSVASGSYCSYSTSVQSQSVGSQSNHPSVRNTEEPREYISYSANIVQPQPVYAAGNTNLPDYSSGVHTVHSSDLRAASIVDPREVQAQGYGNAAIVYAAAQSATRHFVDDQAHGQHQGYYPLERQGSIRPGTVGTPVGIEQLKTEIPGAKAIPYRGTRDDPGERPYGIWPDSPWDSGYSPTFTGKNCNEGCVANLWEGVWRDETEEQVCLLFDHVDFYRLAYITTVHRGTVERPGFTEFSKETQDYKIINSLNDIVKILNIAGRPPGFERISQRRPGNGFTCQQVSDLLSILANKENPNRGNAFGQVLAWANSGDLSPKRVLRNVPESIVKYYGFQNHEALADKRFRWEWLIKSFLYKEDPNPDHAHWYIEGPSKGKKVRKPSESDSRTKRSTSSNTVSSDHSRRPIAFPSQDSHKPRNKRHQAEEH